MRSALGKGLGALISEETAAHVAQQPTPQGGGGILVLPIAKVQADPRQPRRDFSETALRELADSILQKGVLQPILVHPIADGNYQLIAGERRWRASKLAGLPEIPAIVRTGSESERFEIALIENIQREDLNPLEQALGFKRLVDEFKMTQEAVAKIVGKDRAVVANTIRLLQLPEEIQHALKDGMITAGHARALVALENPTAQNDLYERILREQLTVRAVENAVRAHKAVAVKGHVRQPAGEAKAGEIKAVEEELQRTLARKVELQVAGPNAQKGWVRLEFYSLDDLDHLLAQLKKMGTSAA